MSASNVRKADGSLVERRPHDYYPTPAWVTRAILPHLVSRLVTSTDVLDPCCGDGAILREVGRAVGRGRVLGIEIEIARAEVAASACTDIPSTVDALTFDWPQVDLVLTNPPFSLAMEFVERALVMQRRHSGTTAMLLRLAFLESQGRAAFHRANPSDVYVLPKRPSFTGDGKSDSSAYAWFVWGPNRGGRWQALEAP